MSGYLNTTVNCNFKNATTDEVADCKWMSYDEIKSLYDSEKLVNTLDYFFDVFSNDRNSAN